MAPRPPQGTAAAPAAPARRPTAIDDHVWRACAVPFSKPPAVGAHVYYFPSGHAEQCPSCPDFSGLLRPASAFACTVRAVSLHADPQNDEVFAAVSLVPGNVSVSPPEEAPAGAEGKLAVCYFAKQLTQSDANNGGGFSVPRNCAENVFPRLDFGADPPVQTLSLWDLHGRRWDFRHIYRGTPRRHLLTTGWSRFVNEKKLVANDTVVFMRRSAAASSTGGGGGGDLLVGVRRSPRYPATGPRYDVRARVPAAAVAAAAQCAEQSRAFDVVYYPRQCADEFLVPQEEVNRAMLVPWRPGMQVRMRVMEAEESQRESHVSGTIAAVARQGAPWRMLQVDWDKSMTTTSSYVSPWQVEVLVDMPLSKRPRIEEMAEPLESGDGNTAIELTASENENVESLFSSINCSSFPAGMQGARHGPNCLPGLSAPVNINQLLALFDYQIPPRQSAYFDNNLQINCSVQPDQGSNMESDICPSDIPTSDGRRSIDIYPSDNPISDGRRSTDIYPSDIPKSNGTRSIQLFGRTITVVQPPNTDTAQRSGEVADGVFEQGSSVAGLHDRLLTGADVHNPSDSQEDSC